MGKVTPSQTYFPNHFFFGLDFGYSMSFLPLRFNNHYTDSYYNEFSGDFVTTNTKEDQADYALPLSLTVKPTFGFENEYAFASVGAEFSPGGSLIFSSYNISRSYFGQIAAGLPNIKLQYSYNYGVREYGANYWYMAGELGGGYAAFDYKSNEIGLRISYMEDYGRYSRKHFYIGYVMENIIGGVGSEADAMGFRYFNRDPELISEPDKYNRLHGFKFEYVKEHTFNFFFKCYPNYVMPGKGMYQRSEYFNEMESGFPLIEVGFIRQIKAFL